MKINVGDYVRTTKGIGKVTSFDGDLINIDLGYRTTIDYKTELFDIVKSSTDIIDLVMKDDFANGFRVVEIYENNRKDEPSRMVYCEHGDGFIGFYNEDIKSIITREQIEQVSYKVGEE